MKRIRRLACLGPLLVALGAPACDEGAPATSGAAGTEDAGDGGEAGGADGGQVGAGEGEGEAPVDCEHVQCDADKICHPANGRCVECIGNPDCPEDRPTYRNLTGRCGCVSSAECGALRRCDRATERCVREMDGSRCVDDNDCPTRHCGPDSVCVFCTINEHCDVELGEVCNDGYECGQPLVCGQGGTHCPEGGVCDEGSGECVRPPCEGEGEGEGEGGAVAGECPECEEDEECGDGRFCDWGGRLCHDAGRAALCHPCGDNSHCLRPNEPSGTCVQRQADGERLERFCGRDCEADRDCPRGYACSPIGLGVRSCLPLRLEAEGGESGVTCAALVDVGAPCQSDAECGLGGEGFCWEQACAYGCEEAGEERRLCVEGFLCAPVPVQVHVWGGACVRAEG